MKRPLSAKPLGAKSLSRNPIGIQPISVILVVLMLLSVCFCVPAAAATVSVNKESDLTYDSSRTAHNTYDLYGPSTLKAGQTVNVILFLHSGSWTSGDKSEQDENCKRFAKKGYVTATIDYRLYNTSNMVTKQANYAWTVQDMLDDIQTCLNDISKRLTEAGYMVGNAALFGFSAGGHLAQLYSYSMANSANIPVTLVMTQCAPTDFHTSTWTGSTFASGLSLQGILYLANRDLSMSESDINRVSPAYYAKKNPVPTVAIYGMQDTVIGTGHSSVLSDALAATDVEYKILESASAGHTSQFPDSDQTEFYNTCYTYCKTYLNTERQEESPQEETQKKRLPNWAKLLIIWGVIVVLSIVFWILVIRAILRRRKRKKEQR